MIGQTAPLRTRPRAHQSWIAESQPGAQTGADQFQASAVSAPAALPPPNYLAEQVKLELDANGNPKTLSGDDFGEASPVHCTLADGTPGVLKLERPKNMCELKRLEAWWAHQIISSSIMQELGCHSVSYREARTEHKGETLRGVACELVNDMKELAQHEELLVDLKKPDRAILGTVVNAWLGDFDRIVKDENIWLDSHQEVIYGDYGCSGMEHVNAFGVLPKVNRKLFATQATPENVETALTLVRGLSDRQIHDLVMRGAKRVPSACPNVLQEMTHTLITNRDQLRADKTWAQDLVGPQQRATYTMPEKVAKAYLDRVTRDFGGAGRSPCALARAALQDVPGYGPQNGKDRDLVEVQIANAIHRLQENRAPQLEIVPDCFYVWMQLAKKIFTPEESLQLGLGLKHR